MRSPASIIASPPKEHTYILNTEPISSAFEMVKQRIEKEINGPVLGGSSVCSQIWVVARPGSCKGHYSQKERKMIPTVTIYT
jgi:hypothetical protein